MKKLITLMTLTCLSFGIVSAQFSLKKIANSTIKKVENKVENRMENRIDKGINKSLDKTEEGIGNAVKGDGSVTKSAQSETNANKTDSRKSNRETKKQDITPSLPEQAKPAPVLKWAKYDFVPGTEIIFEDNQENEQNGEFPSKWDLAGGVFENAVFDGVNVVYIRDHSIDGGIFPLMKDATLVVI